MKLKTAKDNKDKNIGSRCTNAEKNAVAVKSKLYGVSPSEWVLYASLNFVPSKEDFEVEPQKKSKKKRSK